MNSRPRVILQKERREIKNERETDFVPDPSLFTGYIDVIIYRLYQEPVSREKKSRTERERERKKIPLEIYIYEFLIEQQKMKKKDIIKI